MYDPLRIDWSDPAVAARLLAQGLRLPVDGSGRVGADGARGQQGRGRRSGGANSNSADRGPVLQPVIDAAQRISRIAQQRHGSIRPQDPFPLAPLRRNGLHIAELAEEWEAGGGNPGMINPGHGDRGGASYGLPQLATNSGQPQEFLRTEGRRWQRQFAGLRPGTPAFDRAWTDVAAQEPEAFGEAQRAYVGRNQYSNAVRGAFNRTGVNLDTRADAVRAATWSTALQHGFAPQLLTKAIYATDQMVDRAAPTYDEILIKNIYGERTGYLAGRSSPALQNVVRNRYPEEWRHARDLLPGAR